MNELIDKKIDEAQDILSNLGLPQQQQNRISSLTLLALANLNPNDNWVNASKKSMTLSKDIMEFVNRNYHANYKANTRESFRKNALKPFVDNNIALLNPDDPSLNPNSSKTHYALSDLALDTIKKYQTPQWDAAVKNFIKNQFPENIPSPALLRTLTISNFKSILEDKINLGQFNVFIGSNGSGKSNILEAIAVAGAAKAGDLNFEGLYSRGVRIARPDLMTSSFLNTARKNHIEFLLEFEKNNERKYLRSSLYPENPNDIYTRWLDQSFDNSLAKSTFESLVNNILREYYKNSNIPPSVEQAVDELKQQLGVNATNSDDSIYKELLLEYAIFDLNTKSLRGITPTDSRKTPLGINGEGLDLLIATFNSYEKEFLIDTSKEFFDWIDRIQSEKDEKIKVEGLKVGRSTSTLYFNDRYMLKRNNTFSAENSNEGILHVLFYLALFISNKTPTLFAIDNIETALNPRLCQVLIALLSKLSKERGKQVLITTHNPAILDGLNLLDEEQRLFEVYRDSVGKTKTRRIRFKRDLSDKQFKLSEMWLKGQLGAIPKNF